MPASLERDREQRKKKEREREREKRSEVVPGIIGGLNTPINFTRITKESIGRSVETPVGN